MDDLSPQFALIFTVVGLLGVLLGWAIGAWQARNRIQAMRVEPVGLAYLWPETG